MVLPLPDAGAAITTAGTLTSPASGHRHHSMPRWPLRPASIGCLTLVISVTRSAASTRRGGASRAGDHDVLVAGPGRQRRDDLVDVHPAPLQRIGELVEHVEVVALGGEPARDLGPAVGGRGGVVDVGARLAGPRPARAHLVPLHRAADAVLVVQAAEFAKGRLLAHLPLGALDELEHRDVETLIPGAQRHAERRGGLPLAGAGVHREQRGIATGPGGQSVVGNGERLALWHRMSPLPVDQAAPSSASDLTRRVRVSARSCASRTDGAPSCLARSSAKPSLT